MRFRGLFAGLLLGAGGLFAGQGAAIAAPGPAAPVFTASPAFLRQAAGVFTPATTATDAETLYLSAGTVSGTAPFTFRFRILASPSLAVIIDWTSDTDISAAIVAGTSILVRFEVTDANGLTATADSAVLPITAAFTRAFVGRYDFRGTAAYVTGDGNVFAATVASLTTNHTTYTTATAPDTTVWAPITRNTSPGLSDRTTANGTSGGGARMAGRMAPTLDAHGINVQLTPGWYAIRAAFGDPSSGAGAANVAVVVGDGIDSATAIPRIVLGGGALGAVPDSGGVQGANAVVTARGNSVARSTVATWANGDVNAGEWSDKFQITDAGLGGALAGKGFLRINRRALAGGGGNCSFLDIRTEAAP